MKKDMIEFDTKKSAQEIKSVLSSIDCQIEKVNDPFGGIGNMPVFAVLMHGKASLSDGFMNLMDRSEWGVQVYVYDLGNRRHVEMVALGESSREAAFAAYKKTGGHIGTDYASLANQYYGMQRSKKHRDQIAQMLT